MDSQGWLTKLGLETPKTFDDVVAIAREFKNNDPDGNGENDTWGLGLCNEMSDYSGFGTAEGVLNAFGGSLLQQIWVADENGNLVYMPTSQGTRDGLEGSGFHVPGRPDQ